MSYIIEYANWFHRDGWVAVTCLGFGLGWSIGFRAYWIIIPLVLLAVLGKAV